MGRLGLSSVLIVGILNYLLHLVASSDIQSINKEVEFKTEAPKDVISNAKKDCYEYLHGHLSEIRHHGTTWQNGVSDCSNCTCDNGDIRCFFHFCKGPSTGYMTPPSAGLDNLKSVYDLLMEESSGYPPPGIGVDDYGAYDDEDTKAIASNKKEVNHIIIDDDNLSNTIVTETPLEINDIIIDDDRMIKESNGGKWPPKIVPEKWQKELSAHEMSSTAPLTLMDTLNEVYQTKNKEKKNRSENETHDVFKPYFCGKTCKKVCLRGYKVDPVTGCLKCKCNKCQTSCTNKCPSGYVVDEGGCNTCACLTPSFTTDEDITFKEDPVLYDIQNVHEYLASTIPEENKFEKNIEFFDEDILEPVFHGTEEQNDPPATAVDENSNYKSVGLIRDMFQTTKEQVEEPCNTTDDAVVHDLGVVSTTSSVAEAYHKTKSQESILLNDPFFDLENDDEATIKSIAKDDHSTLLAILLPMGIFCGLMLFLLMHVWRRYHSDKYDINSYRPDGEKEKLRPVKTLHDDHCSLKHV